MTHSVSNHGERVRMLVLLTVLMLAATGCASIIKGSDQIISVKSDPSAANVVITDVRENKDIHSAATPFTISLKRGAGYFTKAMYKVSIEKAGYQKEELRVEGTPGGWYVGGNLLIGGLIGWLIVDPATGAMWTLDPDDINVTLKKQSALAPTDEGLTIALKSAVPPEIEAKLRPVIPTQ